MSTSASKPPPGLSGAPAIPTPPASSPVDSAAAPIWSRATAAVGVRVAGGVPSAEPETVTTGRRLLKVETIWACAALALAIVGSLGPWVTIGFISQAGTEGGGDGIVTLAVGVIGLLLIAADRGQIAVSIVGVLIVGVGIFDVINVSSSGVDVLGIRVGASPGWGLWLVTLSGAALVLCAGARRLGILKGPAE